MTTTRADRHLPVRTCVGCRRRATADMLVRCALTPAGARVSRTAPGRGAWVCGPGCVRSAGARGFARAWRRDVREVAAVLEPETLAAQVRVEAGQVRVETGAAEAVRRPSDGRERLTTRVKG